MLSKKIATGLYSNWDSFINLDNNIIDWIKKSPKIKPKDVILTSLDEAVYTLNQALIEGGKEFLISEYLYSNLDSIFKKRRKFLGGNGFHMGRALYELGLEPLVSFPTRPIDIMMAAPKFKVACKNSIKIPKGAIQKEDSGYDHIIFEFKRDFKKGILSSSRHIFSWDRVASEGIFDYYFLKRASNVNFTEVLVMGYAHLLRPKYKKKSKILIDFLNKPKRPFVHLELGLGSEESVKYAMKLFADYHCSDSWGMNEKECMFYLKAESTSLKNLIDATIDGIKQYGLKRICVHSEMFAFSVSKYDIKKEVEALKLACKVATSLSLGNIKRNLRLVNLMQISNVLPLKKSLNGYNLCIIPTYINLNPKILTGLGDTFASIQAAYIL